MDRQALFVDTPETLSLINKICLEHGRLRVQYDLPSWRASPKLHDYDRCALVGASYTFLLREDANILLFSPTLTFRPESISSLAKFLGDGYIDGEPFSPSPMTWPIPDSSHPRS